MRSPRGGTIENMTLDLPDMNCLKKDEKEMFKHLREKDSYGLRKLQVE